jgi:hypothetical protein
VAAPPSENVPGPHVVQVAEPAAAAVPAAQGVQEVAPAPGAKLPAGQAVQVVALMALEK